MVKRTLHGSTLKKTRVSGFRKRMSTKSGRSIIKARRRKGRKHITSKKV